jgi:hypothetical protein
MKYSHHKVALVMLVDGRFALVKCRLAGLWWVDGVRIFVGHCLASVVALAHTVSGHDAWRLGKGGQLELAGAFKGILPKARMYLREPVRGILDRGVCSSLNWRTRKARDGNAYTYAEFLEWYGHLGCERWQEAPSADVRELRAARIFDGSRQNHIPQSTEVVRIATGVAASVDGVPDFHVQVIEMVAHVDPPAATDPAEAALVSQQQWASSLEHRGTTPAPALDGASEAFETCSEEVVLLDFNRRPKEMNDLLAKGSPLRACREALEREGHNWKLLSSTMVFVHPSQYRDVMKALNGRSLRPSHVVVSSSFEYLVEESLSEIGKGAWAKTRSSLVLQRCIVSETGATVGSSHERRTLERLGKDQELCAVALEIKRTFLCMAPALRRAASVAQSTTEAHSGCGLNPRRSCGSIADS